MSKMINNNCVSNDNRLITLTPQESGGYQIDLSITKMNEIRAVMDASKILDRVVSDINDKRIPFFGCETIDSEDSFKIYNISHFENGIITIDHKTKF